MGLKTAAPKPEASVAPETTILELALYTNYTYQGHTFEKGKPYRFKNSEAMKLLSEQDLGRQIWSIYRPPVRQVDAAKQDVVVDATALDVPEEDEDNDIRGTVGKKRIEVGNDDEIRDILNKVESSEGNVTV